jgi:hypothetical protein
MAVKIGEIVVRPKIELDSKLGTADMLAITITNIENKFQARLDEINKLRPKLKDQSDKIREKREKGLKVFATKEAETEIASIKKAFTLIGITDLKSEFRFNRGTNEKGKKVIQIQVSYTTRGKVKKHALSSGADMDISVSMNNVLIVPAPADIVAMEDEQQETEKQYHSLGDEGMEIQKTLSNVGRLERQARAKFASAVLESSGKEGQDILAKLNSVSGIQDLQRLLPAK